MIKVRQIKVSVIDNSNSKIKEALVKKLHIDEKDIIDFHIRRESIDARDKSNVFYVYEVDVNLENEELVLKHNNKDVEKTVYEEYSFHKSGDKVLSKRPVIVGMGPCGLFAAYMLSLNGFKPIVLDRGEPVEDRVKTIEEFWNTGTLNTNSNVSFGEGGAGTFSDGKLNTLTSDKEHRIQKVYEIFVENGAPEEILYSFKPHIGTDLLRKVIANMRNKMIEMGATFKYNSLVSDIIIDEGRVKKVIVNGSEEIDTDVVVLAIGHSARDTFKLLNEKGLSMESKPFAVGLRVMHDVDLINHSQYGDFAKYLPNASYKLTYNTKEGRGVYSFCMCPGGYVVNASSEENKLCINGMSNHDRNSSTSNSAIVVTITRKDFGDGLFDGVEYQRRLEEKAFRLGDGNIPVEFYDDFKNNTLNERDINIEFKGNTKYADLNLLLPKELSSSIKEGMEYFGNRIKGFNNDDTLLAGIEARTSSPIRINRDDYMESNIKGIYPAGEGAGYAGGITTSAVDGIKVSEMILSIYKELGE